MMKHIIKTGAVSAALAAATLLTPTALADTSLKDTLVSPNRTPASVTFAHKSDKPLYGQASGYKNKRNWKTREAIALCKRAISRQTEFAFRAPHVRADYGRRMSIDRVRRRGIRIEAPVQVSHRGQMVRIASSCTVQRGRVTGLDFNVQQAKRKLPASNPYINPNKRYAYWR